VKATAESETQYQTDPKRNDATVRSKPVPGLHLVATPIGNRADITLRALAVLAGADVIACEDTRVTRKLLAVRGIQTPLVSYREHNAERMRPVLLKRLERGEAVALVSDAGTPLVSDPGYKLVRACIEAGHFVAVVPGPSAALAALVVSGLPTDRFFFAGFLPSRSPARRSALAALEAIEATLVFYESPRRLAAALADMAALLGAREAAVARELTKKFEEVRRAPLDELAAHYRREGPPKGEVVVVVGPPVEGGTVAGEAELDALLDAALEGSSVRDAASAVAVATGLPRRRVYARALALARGRSRTEPQGRRG
jgi:16S rRNA (cytidine1402-2'-O)-methyltransferase